MGKEVRQKLGTKECLEELHRLWMEMMTSKPKKKRPPKRWRKPRVSDSPVGVPEPIEHLRRRMWGDGKPKTITVRGEECMPIDRLAKTVTSRSRSVRPSE